MSGPQSDDALNRAKLDLALAQNDLDRRTHQRVSPAPEEPVLAAIAGESLAVHSISVGGLTLGLGGRAEPGWLFSGEIILPTTAQPLPVILTVLGRAEDGLTRARFEGLDPAAGQAIERYVLWRRDQLLGQEGER